MTSFQRGNPWFWLKNGHFLQFLFLGIIGQENVFYDILERENAFLGYKNKKFEEPKSWHFSKGFWFWFWFWSKNSHFSNFLFLGNKRQKNVFYDILEGKNVFLEYKNKMFKKTTNWHFSKGVSLWFWSKNGHFSTFFGGGNMGQEKIFYDILERKKPF